MKELKYLNICYSRDKLDNKINDFLILNSPNICEFKDEYDLLKLISEKKINLLIMEYNFEITKKVRKINDKVQVFAILDKLKNEYIQESLELEQIKFIQDLTSECSLKEHLQECIKNIDSNKSNIITLKNSYTYDKYNKLLFYKNSVIQLSKKEGTLLNLLIDNENKALSYDDINECVWEGEMSQDALRSLVKELRKKTYKELIKNVSGVGYRIDI